MRDCLTLLPTLTHDWNWIDKYSHIPSWVEGRNSSQPNTALQCLRKLAASSGFVNKLVGGIDWEDLDEADLTHSLR
jgi:hypothetical protein